MVAKQASSPETFLVPPRSFKKTAWDLLVMSLGTLFVGVVIVPLLNFEGGLERPDLWATLTIGGAALYDQIGWTSTLYVTVLIGFFVVSIGGQIFGGPVEATRLRRTLGFIGLLLAASSVPLFLYVACYCLSSREHWAGLIVLVPVNALIIYLALHVGRFVVFDQESRLLALDEAIKRRANRIAVLEGRARHPRWRRVAILAGVIATAASLPVVLLKDEPNWWAFLITIVLLFTLCLTINALGLLILRDSYTDCSSTWWVTWIAPVGLLQMVLFVLTVVLFNEAGLRPGIGSATLAAGCFLAIVIPRKWQPQWLLDLTMNGLAAAWARGKLDAQQQAASKARDELESDLQSALVPSRGGWERFIAALRNSPAG